MMRNAGVIIGFVLALAVCSCSSRPIAPPEWRYEESAIKMHVTADPQLNLYDGMPHALHVCAYQLRDPNTFIQLSETEEGISELLQCKPIDASVAMARTLSHLGVQPGTVLSFTHDRAEGAKYFGIVAGYQLLEKERAVRFFEIPVVTEKLGWFGSTKIKKPGILNLDIDLGPHQIRKAVVIQEEE